MRGVGGVGVKKVSQMVFFGGQDLASSTGAPVGSCVVSGSGIIFYRMDRQIFFPPANLHITTKTNPPRPSAQLSSRVTILYT